jgi:hypothetical protein
MDEQDDSALADRRSIIESYRGSKVQGFQDRVDQDQVLAAQFVLDPIGTLTKFGLIDPTDNDVSIQVTKGSLLDIVQVREAVAARGLAAVLQAPAKRQTAQAAAISVSGRITICITVCWGRWCVTVCIEINLVIA